MFGWLFKKEPGIYALQRSELIDLDGPGTSCARCKWMDGKVFEKDHPLTNIALVHEGCNGIWVEILEDEMDPPPITQFTKDWKGKYKPLIEQ